ncbi:hypothetical protein ABH944_006824 [Caballeronia udeis]|uniref:Uncharacterized protein n=1 Tax=Caballeronia udeis TaxID=1232866 RepID=A0ABW8MSE3_9BURK
MNANDDLDPLEPGEWSDALRPVQAHSCSQRESPYAITPEQREFDPLCGSTSSVPGPLPLHTASASPSPRMHRPTRIAVTVSGSGSTAHAALPSIRASPAGSHRHA